MENAQSTSLTAEAAHAVAAICLLAALADGHNSKDERDRLKEIFESLGDVKTASLYQRVMLGQTSLEREAAVLSTPALRSLAFELALAVCDADGVTNGAEESFLAELRLALDVPAEAAASARHEAEQLASIPVAVSPVVTDPVVAETVTAPEATERGAEAAPDDAATDRLILNAAILNGGLELLPQSLATVAIVPLQLRLVYQIAQANGYEPGSEHLREFLAVAGIGMTSQVVEGHVRKLFGGLARKSLGKGARGVAGTAAGAAMSFATTYALGQAAKRYYAQGRKLELGEVRALFQSQLEQGKALFEQHRGEVQEKARTTDLQSLMRLVR
jgi:uncharacterized protein (DUF697 family)/tellurite resistance protein